MPIIWYSLIYIGCLCFQMFVGISYGFYSYGFFVPDSVDSYEFCMQIHYAGFGEFVSYAALISQAIPIGLRGLNRSKVATNIEVYAFFLASLITFSLMWFMVACGNILYTAFEMRHFPLFLILACYPFAFLVLWLCKTYKDDVSTN